MVMVIGSEKSARCVGEYKISPWNISIGSPCSRKGSN